MYSVELKANNYSDDTFLSVSLEECVNYLVDNGYYNDDWQITLLDIDEDGCVVFCHNIITKEDLEA